MSTKQLLILILAIGLLLLGFIGISYGLSAYQGKLCKTNEAPVVTPKPLPIASPSASIVTPTATATPVLRRVITTPRVTTPTVTPAN